MKVFIPLLCLASLAFAEPPVGDGYPAARSNDNHEHEHNDIHISDQHGHHTSDHHDHHISDHQRSLSQEYGPPSLSARNAPFNGYDYNAPNARNSQNGRQSRFPPATVRVSFNQRFSSSSARNSNNAAARSQHHEHSAPNTRSGPSQEYGPPAARSLSQEYGVPSVESAGALSTEYGVPNTRSSPSEEYGAPVVSARSNQKPQPSTTFRGASAKSLSQEYNAPASRSQTTQSHGYSASSLRSNEIPQEYDAPKSDFSARNAPSSSYGAPARSSSYAAPSARSSNTQGYDSVSQKYGAPNQRELSETYGAPNVRSLSQEFGVPSSRSSQNTEAVTSSYPAASSRSSPASTYLPAAREAMPSQQYGVPDQDNQGYEEARARALNELLNQEPASYDFGYQIEDQESGSDFGHSETREENKAQGSYFVVHPDGSKQTVEYEADERGFKPRISVEPAASGYDNNAQDLARAAQGPY